MIKNNKIEIKLVYIYYERSLIVKKVIFIIENHVSI